MSGSGSGMDDSNPTESFGELSLKSLKHLCGDSVYDCHQHIPNMTTYDNSNHSRSQSSRRIEYQAQGRKNWIQEINEIPAFLCLFLLPRKRASPLRAGPIGSFPASPKYSIVQHHCNRDLGIPSTASFIVAPYSNVPTKNSIILCVNHQPWFEPCSSEGNASNPTVIEVFKHRFRAHHS